MKKTREYCYSVISVRLCFDQYYWVIFTFPIYEYRLKIYYYIIMLKRSDFCRTYIIHDNIYNNTTDNDND